MYVQSISEDNMTILSANTCKWKLVEAGSSLSFELQPLPHASASEDVEVKIILLLIMVALSSTT